MSLYKVEKYRQKLTNESINSDKFGKYLSKLNEHYMILIGGKRKQMTTDLKYCYNKPFKTAEECNAHALNENSILTEQQKKNFSYVCNDHNIKTSSRQPGSHWCAEKKQHNKNE
jgi:hypothetical protein